MSAGRYDNPFELVAPDGRVLAEATDLASARYAAGVLLEEEGLERVGVRHVDDSFARARRARALRRRLRGDLRRCRPERRGLRDDRR